jgi:flagellar motility protein MotE (MotC chaperone)
MNRLLLVGLASLALFGVSVGVSFYLQQQQQQAHEQPQPKAAPGAPAPHGPAPGGHASGAEEPPRAAVRPPYNAGAEEAARLTAELRSRLAAARENERQTAARKKQLDLIQQDLRDERAAIDDLRKQAKKELDAVNKALAELERQRAAAAAEPRRAEKSGAGPEVRPPLPAKEQQDNLKKMGVMYSTMPPESAAKILRSLSDTGKMDLAAQLLALMQERQAAKVLTELNDPVLAAQLLERLKVLRRRPAAAAGPAPLGGL